MNMFLPFMIICVICPHFVHSTVSYSNQDVETRRMDYLVDIIEVNLKGNGWSNIICCGRGFTDNFHIKIRHLPLTFNILDLENDNIAIQDVVAYHSNMVILKSEDLDEFENALRKVMLSPYWHPLSNTILYYGAKEQDDIPKLFMIFWFYKICNAIIIQYDDEQTNMLISMYNPYVSDNYLIAHKFGCWKTTKVERPVGQFRKNFICEEGCYNVTLHSKLRNFHLGTCIGWKTLKLPYGDMETLKNLNLFEDKGKNLHGFTLKGLGIAVAPFMNIEVNNGKYILKARDGMVWNTAAERMNFTIDLAASEHMLSKPFNFEENIQLIFTFARRHVDMITLPVYLMDIIIVDMDLSIPYKESGVCILSHRAGFETVLFDAKLLEENYALAIQFLISFLCIWLLFFIFHCFETGTPSFDQVGKDLVNTIRNVLSITLHKPPKHVYFRIYLGISMWCFFILNFSTQAAIISFFSAYKRGKEVDFFEDVVEKGYVIEGLASPDMVLPDDQEIFEKINEKVVSLPDLFECLERMTNDSRRFCLLDCSVGYYLKSNRLNDKGEQFLHIAKDRIHSHYLVMMLQKHSPLTNTFNKYLRMSFEAGLIKKWEQYRFSDMIEEVPLKPLNLEDLIGIFKCYYILLGLSSLVFCIEVTVDLLKRVKTFLLEMVKKRNRTRVAKKKLGAERQLGKMKVVNTSTQTASP